MPKIIINKNKCKGCLLCVNFCPKNLIFADKRLNKKGAQPVYFIKNSACLGCALCAVVCPDCCIEVYR